MHLHNCLLDGLVGDGIQVGKGSFISDDLADMLKKQRGEQLEKIRQQLRTCREMGVDRETIKRLTDEVYKEEDVC